MRSRGVSWVLPRAIDDGAAPLVRQASARLKIHGPSGKRVDGVDLAAFGGEPQRLRRDAE